MRKAVQEMGGIILHSRVVFEDIVTNTRNLVRNEILKSFGKSVMYLYKTKGIKSIDCACLLASTPLGHDPRSCILSIALPFVYTVLVPNTRKQDTQGIQGI